MNPESGREAIINIESKAWHIEDLIIMWIFYILKESEFYRFVVREKLIQPSPVVAPVVFRNLVIVVKGKPVNSLSGYR
jgi:hypothetical protein